MENITQETKNKIANLILKGASYPDTVERTDCFISPYEEGGETYYGCCVLGLAFVGSFETAKEAHTFLMKVVERKFVFTVFEERFGVPYDFLKKIEHLHIQKVKAEEIARRLEADEI